MNYENTTFMLQISKSGFSQKPPTEVEGVGVINNGVYRSSVFINITVFTIFFASVFYLSLI